MTGEVFGIGQRRSGTGKSGKPYDFTPIHCAYAANDVVGKKVEEVTFSHLQGMEFPDIHVGDIIHFSYDRRGFLEEFDVVEKTGKIGNLKINNG